MAKLKITQRQYTIKAPSILDKVLPWRSADIVEVLCFDNTFVSEFTALYGEVNRAILWGIEFCDISVVESINNIDAAAKAFGNLSGPLIIETQRSDIKRVLMVEVL
ncbi:hypothetical protein CPT_Melin_054 [Acinetobacter phage Melin]|nr:hypothetical protein CPT_Melin_054 [Acinetobacter phage Melin]